jgi:hypothetical protein
MNIHLRQVALVASNLQDATKMLTEVLGLHVCHEDDAVAEWGLANVLIPIGTDFLEVVAPTGPGTAAGRYLDRRGGDGGYMVITQSASETAQQACRQRATERGVRVAYEKNRPNGYRLMQLHPADMGASFLEIDVDPEKNFVGHWNPAGGNGWQSAVDQSRTAGLAGVQLQSDNPDALAQHWAHVLGLPVDQWQGVPAITLNNANLVFHPVHDGRGAGLGGVYIDVSDRAAVLSAAARFDAVTSDNEIILCGTRFLLSDLHG